MSLLKSRFFVILFLSVLTGCAGAPQNRSDPDSTQGRQPANGARSERFFKQLTFSPDKPAAEDYSDPSQPTFLTPNELSITGSGLLSWAATTQNDAWRSFLHGATPTWKPIPLLHNDGVTAFDIPIWGEEAWDVTIERTEDHSASPVLLGGAMTPQPPNLHAKWPDDNWSRRTYVFTQSNGAWVQSAQPLFFDPAKNGWIGHNYGHQFIKDQSGHLWMFYERVSAVDDNAPVKTELFARRAMSFTQVAPDQDEIQVFKIGDPPFPSTVRSSGALLAEGPRPFKVELGGKTFYLVSFSSSDWNSDKYGINLLWSDKIEGPYQPYLTEDGKDLKNFGSALAAKHALSYGPGRGNFFQDPDGHWWVIFNAIDKATADAASGPTPGQGPFRNLYLAPVKISLQKTGIPAIEILESD